ncbi:MULTISPECIES: 4Fe-4S dicluster domain-containing protein [Bacillus]|uniref:4Fe-4S dicluster domain-containing protein n=1 Tax=Bacillus TaxID=1386 RepID=UPI000301481A|nr:MULTISPECIES: 4Fe-4S dicluster domain-containing protein [Bacillus]
MTKKKKRLAFSINMDRCIGCNACTISCKSFYDLEPSINRRFVRESDEMLTGTAKRCYISTACNHCDEPACAKACPTGAYTKLENGIVKHDQERCIGCQMCATACPYEVPQFDTVKKKMDKCSMCSDRIDEGEDTICVSSCPMEAISIIDLNSINESDYVTDVAGFVDSTITGSSTRFILPEASHSVRRKQ